MTSLLLANWNGEEMPLDEVRVSVLDRAFLFGDGVYEVLRVYEGRPWLEIPHLERLERSLQEVRIRTDVERIRERMHQTLANSRTADGLVYIQVTRGVAPRMHRFPVPPPAPNELIYVQEFTSPPYEEYRTRGASVITVPETRWNRRDIKSVNLLGNCLASQAAAEAGCIEAVFVDACGEITEGTHTSLFGVKDGSLLTSPTGPHILPGITRGFVLELAARAGVPIIEQPLKSSDLPEISELFLTGTTTEVLPITQIDGQPVGDGVPGPVTHRLFETYRAAVSEWLHQR